MRYNVVLRYIGVVMLINAVFLLISAVISLFNGMDSGFYPLVLSAALTFALGAFPMIFVPKTNLLHNKEAYVVVVGSWIMACVVGTFPYLLWGGEFDLAGAWFESVSGFTATGATALQDVEALPKGLLFWRSCTHLLGGIGVMMFVLVVVPAMGRTKTTLTNVEMSTMAKDNYNYKTQKIVQILLSLYVGLTVAETLLLKMAGMNWFDAVNHSFSTISTGGFSTRNMGIAYYDSITIEVILMFFMALSGIHFGLIYATLVGKKNNIFRSEVAKFYIATLVVAGFLIAINLWATHVYPSLGESLRYGYFHAISVISTTAFATADTSVWSSLSVLILMFLMFQCGCAGSTSGGIKSDRVWLALKMLRARVLLQQHPNAVTPIKLNNVTQSDMVVAFAMMYIVIYLLLVFVGSVVFAATGMDLMTSFSLSACHMSNLGTGFGNVGSMGNFSEVSPFVKCFSTLYMLLGRLEIFGFIQLFLFKWWK